LIGVGYRIDLGSGAGVTRWGDAYTVDGPGSGARAQVRVERDGVRLRLPRGQEVSGVLAQGASDARRFRVAEDESLLCDTDG
jgi:hypothetical protein